MSSPSSSRYRSRLFNFLTDRAVRWSDRAAEAFRHAQIAATTAVRAVLLPLWTIAESLGLPTRSAAGGGGRGDRASFAPGTDREREVASDAPIRATLTILEATGWPTVDRLDREALPPADDRKTHQQSDSPAPLEIVLSDRELQAIAPARPITATVRGLASHLGSADLVLISTDNEIVGRFGAFSQRMLDRDVTKLLDRLTRPALTPSMSPGKLSSALEQTFAGTLAFLDRQWSRLEDGALTPALPPSGFAIERSFDLHRELDRPISPADALAQTVVRWTLTLSPISEPPAAIEGEPISRTEIQGTRWSIDPADRWWRNGLDLVRATVISSVVNAAGAIVKATDPNRTAPEMPDAPFPQANATPHLPELQSKVGNRIRDWLTDASALEAAAPSVPAKVQAAVPAAVSAMGELDRATSTTGTLARSRAEASATATQHTETAVTTSPDRDAPTDPADMDFAPEWIDARVENDGYVTHPLVRLLRWLDRGMATIEGWVERAIAAIRAWRDRRRKP